MEKEKQEEKKKGSQVYLLQIGKEDFEEKNSQIKSKKGHQRVAKTFVSPGPSAHTGKGEEGKGKKRNKKKKKKKGS